MSIWHLLLLLVVVALVFGTGKLSKIGPDLGAAIRGFKESMGTEPAPKPVERLQADAAATGESVPAGDKVARS
ncbi:MAG: twin-arginine translocase TatA/TatE family subunit [Rhodanobacter sp.]|nr:MAG: twin-arginine translocase TatA/TatE family subunit [Rhodanobacter sp.]TAM09940.1 MAG: twin-arginine translocase TatA/TatE family subunit [Rhodanobacter sp.]TAM36721.1 MAG: twin-arginine translocase TatA/TatE family subunit [Rhodanobacter sp.]